MRKISDALREQMQTRADFYATAVITFANGVVQNLTKGDFYLENGVVDSAETSSFPYGVVIPKSTTLSLVNDRDRWRNYSFDGARIQLYANYDLDSGTTETIKLGEFTVIEPETYGEVITVTAMDDCYKLDQPYTTSLSYPASAYQVFRDIVLNTGIKTAVTQFSNQNLNIKTKPTDVTFRQVMGAICGIAGGNGRFDANNLLKIIKYDTSRYETTQGGTFDLGSSLLDLLQGYMNTTDGMTAVVTSAQNNKVFSFNGPSWFYLFGRNASKIYVDCHSFYQLGGTAPTGYVKQGPGIWPYASGYVGTYGVLCKLYYRSLTIGDRQVFKIRWEGYNRGTTVANAPSGSALKYEMFLFDDGYIFFNVIQAPTEEYIHEYALRLYLPDSTIYNYWRKTFITGIGSQFYIARKDSETSTFRMYYTADDLATAAYSSGDALEGGSFKYWDGWSSYDTGDFSDQSDIQVLRNFAPGMTMTVNDVVITGAEIETDDETFTAVGSNDGYKLKIKNVLAEGIEQTVINRIGSSLIGLRFRPFTGDHIPYPVAEAMDAIYFFAQDGNLHTSIVTDVNYTFSGYTTLKCSADSPLRNSAAFYTEGTEVARVARRASSAAVGEYGQAVQMMLNLITNGLGLFFSEEEASNGGTIYYLHDHKDKAESVNIWRMSANIFSVSSDGGKTWNAGIDSSGNAVVNVLSAIGIVFDWARGGTLALGGADNKNGTLNVYDADGSRIIRMNNNGIAVFGMYSEDGRAYSEVQYGISKRGFYLARPTNSGTIQVGLLGAPLDAEDEKGTPLNAIGYYVRDASQVSSLNSSIKQSSIGFGTYKASGDNITKTNIVTISSGYVTNRWPEWKYVSDSSALSGFRKVEKNVNMWAKGCTLLDGDVAILGKLILNGTLDGELEQVRCKKLVIRTEGLTYATAVYITGSIDLNGHLDVAGELHVEGAKSRACKTKHYDTVLMGAYETSTPYFGDIGSGITDEDGVCYVEIDDIFTEVANTTAEYHVFLQKEGPGDLWIDQKQPGFFVVRGTPHLKFSWEIKAMQLGYEMTRNERFEKGEEDETA